MKILPFGTRVKISDSTFFNNCFGYIVDCDFTDTSGESGNRGVIEYLVAVYNANSYATRDHWISENYITEDKT